MPRTLTDETPNGEAPIDADSQERGELVPARLGEKLLQIRDAYGLTQGVMLLIVNPTETDENNRARISQYELGKRVPSLIEIRNYARFAGVTIEMLLNADLDLPVALRQSYEGGAREKDKEEKKEKNGETDVAALPSPADNYSPACSDDCYPVHLSETAAGHCKRVYLERLGELPLHGIPLLTLDKFLVQMILSACDDHRERGAGSNIVRRMRHFFGVASSEERDD